MAREGAASTCGEVIIARAVVTPQELRDWIVTEVRRRRPEWSTFEAEFTVQRLAGPQRSGLTWSLESVPQLPEWSAEIIEAFSDIVWQARRRFDLKD